MKQRIVKALAASALPLPLKIMVGSKLDKLSEAQVAQYVADARALLTPILNNAPACEVLTRWGVDLAELRRFLEGVG